MSFRSALCQAPCRARPPYLAPSLLAADPLALGHAATLAREAGADWLHVDVMDGHFVPNLSFGPHVVAGLARATHGLRLDVHLMLQRPATMFAAFAAAGAHHVTFHLEAEGDVATSIATLRQLGVGVGLSLHPDTPVQRVAPYLHAIDLVLLMSVRPGFGGQAYMPAANARLRELAGARAAGAHDVLLEVDGGINVDTAGAAHAAGADALVAGSAFYKPGDAAAHVARLAALRAAAKTTKG